MNKKDIKIKYKYREDLIKKEKTNPQGVIKSYEELLDHELFLNDYFPYRRLVIVYGELGYYSKQLDIIKKFFKSGIYCNNYQFLWFRNKMRRLCEMGKTDEDEIKEYTDYFKSHGLKNKSKVNTPVPIAERLIKRKNGITVNLESDYIKTQKEYETKEIAYEYKRLGKYDDAIEIFRDLIFNQNRHSYHYYKELCVLYRKKGEYNNELNIIDSYLDDAPYKRKEGIKFFENRRDDVKKYLGPGTGIEVKQEKKSATNDGYIEYLMKRGPGASLEEFNRLNNITPQNKNDNNQKIVKNQIKKEESYNEINDVDDIDYANSMDYVSHLVLGDLEEGDFVFADDLEEGDFAFADDDLEQETNEFDDGNLKINNVFVGNEVGNKELIKGNLENSQKEHENSFSDFSSDSEDSYDEFESLEPSSSSDNEDDYKDFESHMPIPSSEGDANDSEPRTDVFEYVLKKYNSNLKLSYDEILCNNQNKRTILDMIDYPNKFSFETPVLDKYLVNIDNHYELYGYDESLSYEENINRKTYLKEYGMALFNAKRYDEAEDFYKKLRKNSYFKNDYHPYKRLSMIYKKTGNGKSHLENLMNVFLSNIYLTGKEKLWFSKNLKSLNGRDDFDEKRVQSWLDFYNRHGIKNYKYSNSPIDLAERIYVKDGIIFVRSEQNFNFYQKINELEETSRMVEENNNYGLALSFNKTHLEDKPITRFYKRICYCLENLDEYEEEFEYIKRFFQDPPIDISNSTTLWMENRLSKVNKNLGTNYDANELKR